MDSTSIKTKKCGIALQETKMGDYVVTQAQGPAFMVVDQAGSHHIADIDGHKLDPGSYLMDLAYTSEANELSLVVEILTEYFQTCTAEHKSFCGGLMAWRSGWRQWVVGLLGGSQEKN
ncbi:hypothetical protein BJY01DRAFT_253798 [Aspergillus pseudoustus]|uniref:Uncharacterized protein n=1 Tax=Aspergillus pseudoustus TaxID=1810923 RepID=A0ABR4IY35_9EURO